MAGNKKNMKWRLDAARILARWKAAGFDVVLRHRSGYCSPGNSEVMHTQLPDGYSVLDIDDDEALREVSDSLEEDQNAA